MKSIGYGAFQNCQKISKVGIPSSVVNIGHYAFSNCSGLKQCVFAEDIQIDNISSSMFHECKNLEKITIPSSVTTIEGQAFLGCSKLEKIKIPSSVTTIEGWAFYGCSRLEKISIPANVTAIGASAFGGCSNIGEVEFEKESKLTTIESEAFSNCAITSIRIPAGVTKMGYSALACPDLVDVTFMGDFGEFESLVWCI